MIAEKVVAIEKPPYRVPLMSEVREIPWNGLGVASVFAGSGGSSTGYRMAGFRVLYACEVVPEAAKSYRANAAPYTYVDNVDVRTVKGGEILERCKTAWAAMTDKPWRELDVFDGSPPCETFSTSGKRAESWGKARKETGFAADDLFFEYARLLKDLQPRVFVAENVAGLIKGVSRGYFREIMAALRAAGYLIEARVLDAQHLGVPQVRKRVIFVGTRADLEIRPAFPDPLPYVYALRDVIPALDRVERRGHGYFPGDVQGGEKPSSTIMASAAGAQKVYDLGSGPRARFVRQFSGKEIDVTDQPAPTVLAGVQGFRIHPTRTVLEDVGRREVEGDVAQGFAGTGLEKKWETLVPGEAHQKNFNLVRTSFEKPAPTVAAMGAGRTLASIAHPSEPRKFSIDELKAICSFPPDFILTGTYAQQWERCGDAVPPLMMRAIARAVASILLS